MAGVSRDAVSRRQKRMDEASGFGAAPKNPRVTPQTQPAVATTLVRRSDPRPMVSHPVPMKADPSIGVSVQKGITVMDPPPAGSGMRRGMAQEMAGLTPLGSTVDPKVGVRALRRRSR